MLVQIPRLSLRKVSMGEIVFRHFHMESEHIIFLFRSAYLIYFWGPCPRQSGGLAGVMRRSPGLLFLARLLRFGSMRHLGERLEALDSFLCRPTSKEICLISCKRLVQIKTLTSKSPPSLVLTVAEIARKRRRSPGS